ncbi:MAG: DUF3501 family protein [Acidimicrobiia bacterium]|nr:DUF3501 family protein [Acidimicrobiia bacterium]
MRKLTTDDIKDLRAYERERDDFRRSVIEQKRRRRVVLGDFLSLTFENTDTMRFQVQEMARAERMLTDEQIRHEVDTYNQLIPDPGELSGTLFVELTSKEALQEWLPKLVGIQRSVSFWLPDGSRVAGEPQEEDEARLTREETTASVHFVKFRFTPEQAAAFARGPAQLVLDHPEYHAVVELSEEQREELAGDLADVEA